MSVKFYTAQENGNLKYIEEVEGTDDVDAAREALFEARPRLANTEEFICIVGDFEDGTVETISKQEVVQTAWASSRSSNEVDEDEEDEPAPAPKRRGRPPGTKNKPKATPAKKAAPKAAAKKAPARKAPTARKPAARKASGKKTPFTRNAASDE